jgi:hypothetical protein
VQNCTLRGLKSNSARPRPGSSRPAADRKAAWCASRRGWPLRLRSPACRQASGTNARSREIPKSARQRTANSAERILTAVMAVPNPGVCEKSRKFLDAESVAARRGQIVKPCDRAAVSLPPHPSTCRDSQPIAASSSAAREDALSGCRHALSDRAPYGLIGVRYSQGGPLALSQESSALPPGSRKRILTNCMNWQNPTTSI